jgi:hypothetical protein
MKNHSCKTQAPVAQLITDQQLQNRWQRTDVTLWRLRKAGVLPFVQVGRHPRYRLDDILHLEQSGVPCSQRIRPGIN